MGLRVVQWDAFVESLDWRQGEHVTAIGTTGSGKSHVLRHLLDLRTYSVVFGSKPQDETLRGFQADGWERIHEWPPDPHVRRALLWPPLRTREDVAVQAEVFDDAFGSIFAEGGWCVYLDELPYITGTLGLAFGPELLWQQGRSLGISLVVATQRPRHVPLLAYSQATHLLLWRASDRQDLARLSELGGTVNADRVRSVVSALPSYAFLYVNTRTGRLVVSRAPAPKG